MTLRGQTRYCEGTGRGFVESLAHLDGEMSCDKGVSTLTAKIDMEANRATITLFGADDCLAATVAHVAAVRGST